MYHSLMGYIIAPKHEPLIAIPVINAFFSLKWNMQMVALGRKARPSPQPMKTPCTTKIWKYLEVSMNDRTKTLQGRGSDSVEITKIWDPPHSEDQGANHCEKIEIPSVEELARDDAKGKAEGELKASDQSVSCEVRWRRLDVNQHLR